LGNGPGKHHPQGGGQSLEQWHNHGLTLEK
jgi:hypothetical protein